MTDAVVIPMLWYQGRLGIGELWLRNKSELDMGFQMEPEIKDYDLERENVRFPYLIASLHLGPTVTCFPRKRVRGCPGEKQERGAVG